MEPAEDSLLSPVDIKIEPDDLDDPVRSAMGPDPYSLEDAVVSETPDPPTNDTVDPLPAPSDDDDGSDSHVADIPDEMDIDPPDDEPAPSTMPLCPPLIDTDPPPPVDPTLEPPDIEMLPDC